MPMKITFDPKKAAHNLYMHKVDFAEAATIFLDPSAVTRIREHGEDVWRYTTLGRSDSGKHLIVVWAAPEDRAERKEEGRHAMEQALLREGKVLTDKAKKEFEKQRKHDAKLRNEIRIISARLEHDFSHAHPVHKISAFNRFQIEHEVKKPDITLRFDSKIADYIQACAESEGKNFQDMVHVALQQYMENKGGNRLLEITSDE